MEDPRSAGNRSGSVLAGSTAIAGAATSGYMRGLGSSELEWHDHDLWLGPVNDPRWQNVYDIAERDL
jgi:hypothetical protein